VVFGLLINPPIANKEETVRNLMKQQARQQNQSGQRACTATNTAFVRKPDQCSFSSNSQFLSWSSEYSARQTERDLLLCVARFFLKKKAKSKIICLLADVDY
jgi:hypothetical protein